MQIRGLALFGFVVYDYFINESPNIKNFARGYELQEKLGEKLNAEEKELLTELVEPLFDEGCVDAEKKFERGFRLGVLMTAEIFTEQDIFL